MKIKEIEFTSKGLKLAGTLYLPTKNPPTSGWPLIIPCSGYQGFDCFYPRLFAANLTRSGFACIGFDYRGFARSEGEPGRVLLEEQVEDVLSAIEFSRSVSEVSSVDLGLLGWGMGSANVLRAAIAQSEIKAVAVLNGFFDGERWLKRVLSEDRFKEMKQQLAQDQERRQQGETSRTVPAFTYYPLDSNTSQHVSVELSGLHNFGDPVQLGFWESILRLKQDDLVSGLSKTSAAIFVAHGTANKLHPPEESMEFFSALTNNKEHYIIEGAHNDFMYEDNPEFKKLMQAVSSFFQRYF